MYKTTSKNHLLNAMQSNLISMDVYLLTTKAVGCDGDLVVGNHKREVQGSIPVLCNVFTLLGESTAYN